MEFSFNTISEFFERGRLFELYENCCQKAAEEKSKKAKSEKQKEKR